MSVRTFNEVRNYYDYAITGNHGLLYNLGKQGSIILARHEQVLAATDFRDTRSCMVFRLTLSLLSPYVYNIRFRNFSQAN